MLAVAAGFLEVMLYLLPLPLSAKVEALWSGERSLLLLVVVVAARLLL